MNIISRIKKNEYVSLETIGTICKILNCTPNDILNFENMEDIIDEKENN